MKLGLVKTFPNSGLKESLVFSWISVFTVCNYIIPLVADAKDASRREPSHLHLEIRLSGENASEGIGLVQYLDHSGTWSNVCVDAQITPAVRVACRQLGYNTGNYEGDFLGSENVSLSASSASVFHVNCVGSEKDLEECRRPVYIPGAKQNCSLLHVNCSFNSDVERGIRLISRPGNPLAAGLVQVYDASTNDWVFICPHKFTFDAARLVCNTFGMTYKDTKSEANPTYLTEDQREAPMKILDCNASASFLEDCHLETMDRRCSGNDFINITCKTDTGCLQPPVFIAPHSEYDLRKTLDVRGVNNIDVDVRTCSGLKIALLRRRQLPLQDFIELDFGTTEILLRRCTAVESCVFLETYAHNASFGCNQWTVIHLELDDDYLAVGILPKSVKPPTSGFSNILNFPYTFQTTYILPTSTSHTVTYQVTRGNGINKCFVRSDDGEVGQQCGDAYVHKSLCYSCGCCFRSQAQPSCYRPILPTGLEPPLVNLRCDRTAFQMFGRVLTTAMTPTFTSRPFFIAVIMQRITPNIRFAVDFGDQTIKTDVPPKKDELPSWISENLGSVHVNDINYVYVFNHSYSTAGKYTAVVNVTDPGILKEPTSISMAITVDVEALPPLKQLIGFFHLLNNGPSCAKCTLSLIVLSEGLTDDCITTIDPGDGSGPQVVEMHRSGVRYSEWVVELVKQMRVLIPLESFHSGLLDHSYATSGQFMAEATMKEPDRDKRDILSAKTIITVDLRPHLTPIIGTVALFNDGPVYQRQNYSLLLVVEHLTPNAKVAIADDFIVLFPDLTPKAGLLLPAWAKDEVIEYPLIGDRTDYLMLELSHAYEVSGAHILEARIWDDEYDDIITIHTEVIILQLPCDSRELQIRGGGGLIREASLKLKQKDFVKLSINVDLDCNITASLKHAWTISYAEAHGSNNVMERQVLLPLEAIATLKELFIPAFALDTGYYLFQFQMTIPTNNANGYILVFNQTWVQMTYSPRLSLFRIGILRKVAGLDSTITIDGNRLLNKVASDISATGDGDNISYTWFCTPEGVSLPGSLLPNDSLPESKGCFGDGLKLEFHDRVFVFKTDQLIFNETSLPTKFNFTLVMTQRGEAPPQIASHELTVIADYDPVIRIDCVANCPPDMNMMEELVLEAVCHKNCKYGETVTYEWQFNPASTNNMKTEINWETETSGNSGTSLIVNANVFPREARGESYAFVIIATKANGLMGSESFSVNIPVEIGAWVDRSDATTYHFLGSNTVPFWTFMVLHVALTRILSATII